VPKGDIETFHEDGQWHNRVEGKGGLLGSYQDKREAEEAGRKAAHERQVEHIIKKLDGSIGEKTSHGNDPRNVPG
jgi:hypothetical protein